MSLGMDFARRRMMAIKKEPKYEWAVYQITKAIDESAGGTNASSKVMLNTAMQAARSYTVSSNGIISLTNPVSTSVNALKAGDYLVGITSGATNTATTGSMLYKVKSVSTSGLMYYNISYTTYSPKNARGTDTGRRVVSDTLDYPVDGIMGNYWYVLIKGDV